MASVASLSGKRGRAAYRRHRVFDELREQRKSIAWFAREVPCDYSLLYLMRDGKRGIPEWFAVRASEILGKPVGELFSDPVATEGNDL